MKIIKIIYKLTKIIFYISIIAFIISYFQIKKLPEKNNIIKSTYNEPLQTKTNTKPFSIEKNGKTYLVTPLYDYKMNGLIVSYHHSSDWLDYYHKKWEDYLNLKDICVIWGQNIENNVYQKMTFKNKSYSCWWNLKSGINRTEWSKFKNANISNNHLLSNNDKINETILKTRKGDQIYLKGYLVNYSLNDGVFKRESSVIRTDTGMGSCETIFVEDFQIIKKANSPWRDIYDYSKYLIIGNFIFLIILFFKDV